MIKKNTIITFNIEETHILKNNTIYVKVLATIKYLGRVRNAV